MTAHWPADACRFARELGVEAQSATVSLAKGATIFRDGDSAEHVYWLIEGVAKTLIGMPDGSTRPVSFHFPNDLLLAPRRRRAFSAQAITTVTLLKLRWAAFKSAIAAGGEFAERVVAALQNALFEQYRHAAILSRHDAAGRLAMFIEAFEAHAGSHNDMKRGLYLPMSRNDIAHFLGLTAEALSRQFASLQRRGIVAAEGRRRLRVTDRAALLRLISP